MIYKQQKVTGTAFCKSKLSIEIGIGVFQSVYNWVLILYDS